MRIERVRGADVHVFTARHDEHTATIRGIDDGRARHRQAIALHDQVDALGQLQPLTDVGRFQLAQRICPRPRGIDDGLGMHGESDAPLAPQRIRHLDPDHSIPDHRIADHGSALPNKTRHRRVISDHRAMACGASHIRQRQPCIVGDVFGIHDGPGPGVGLQRWLIAQQARAIPYLMSLSGFDAAEFFIGPQPSAQRCEMRTRAATDDDWRNRGKMRRNLTHDGAFVRRFPHQPHIALGEIAQATVHQLGGAATGARAEVIGFHQRSAQATHRRIAHDARARNAAADHEHIKGFSRQTIEQGCAVAQVQGRACHYGFR